jgi:hypothetical protein
MYVLRRLRRGLAVRLRLTAVFTHRYPTIVRNRLTQAAPRNTAAA